MFLTHHVHQICLRAGVGGAHLYGRRLVVEYAAEETGMEELRTKTARKFRGGDDGDDDVLLGGGGAAAAAKRMKKGL